MRIKRSDGVGPSPVSYNLQAQYAQVSLRLIRMGTAWALVVALLLMMVLSRSKGKSKRYGPRNMGQAIKQAWL